MSKPTMDPTARDTHRAPRTLGPARPILLARGHFHFILQAVRFVRLDSKLTRSVLPLVELAQDISKWRRHIGLIGLLFLTGIVGCFSGTYTDRMKKTMQTVEQQVLFTQATPVLDALGKQTGVSIHMPMFVDSKAKTLQSGADSQPPFAQLPGFAYAYRVQINQLPAYVYFAPVPKAGKTAMDVQKELRGTIAKKFSDAAWRDIAVKKPDGSTMTVKRLSVTGDQEFSGQQRAGRFDLYLYQAPNHHLLIGWRAPTAVAAEKKFFETAEQSIGSIQ